MSPDVNLVVGTVHDSPSPVILPHISPPPPPAPPPPPYSPLAPLSVAALACFVSEGAVIAEARLTYSRKGLSSRFRSGDTEDVFRLQSDRLMRGKKKGYSVVRCVQAVAAAPIGELGVVHVPERYGPRVCYQLCNTQVLSSSACLWFVP
jgi:hypothetical protein